MKLENLTPEQKSSLKDKKKFFVDKFLNNEKINMHVAIECIGFVYSLIKRPMPKIYQVISPMAAQRLANKLKKTESKYYSFGTYLNIYWASFYAYYETFVDFGIITEEKFPKYFQLRKYIDSNIFMTIEFDNAIIICEKPLYVKKNSNGMHCLDGPAIAWEDGYEQYKINGRAISKKNFYSIKNKTYTPHEFIQEKNEEVKSVCLQMMTELYGDSYIASFLSPILKEVNSYVDKKDNKFLEGTTKGMNVGVYTLFKGSIGDYNIAYVRCYCPSTDRMFYLGVEPRFNNAKDAIASLYSIPSKLKNHIVSISRQGERFSTIFTEEGLRLLKNNSNLGELTSISGDEYFSKMQYEF